MKEKWSGLAQRWRGALEKYRYVLLVIGAGVVLLMLPAGGGQDSSGREVQESGETEAFDLERFEEKLAQALSQVEGAGKARVVLTLEEGSRQVLARDREQDRDGGAASTVVTVGRGAGNQDVVSLQTVARQFRGALVVCPGGGDPQVRLRLIEAVSALTGLGANRVSVCQGEG